MAHNPIIAAKLEFLGTAIVGLTAAYLKGELDDNQALEAAADALEAFVQPVGGKDADDQPAAATA